MGWLDKYEKAQTGKRSYKEIPPEKAKDNIPTFTPKPLIQLTPEQIEERRRQAILEQTGTISPIEEQSGFSKFWDILADPFTAAELYTKQGYVPDHFRKAVKAGHLKPNAFEIAGDFINPFDAVRVAADAPASFAQGDIGMGALELLSAAPLIGEAATVAKTKKHFIKKATKEDVYKALDEKPVKQEFIDKTRQEIRDEIDHVQGRVDMFDEELTRARRAHPPGADDGGLTQFSLRERHPDNYFDLMRMRKREQDYLKKIEGQLDDVEGVARSRIKEKMVYDPRYFDAVRQKLIGKHYSDYIPEMPDMRGVKRTFNEAGELIKSPKKFIYSHQDQLPGDSWSHSFFDLTPRQAVKKMDDVYENIPAGGQFREASLSSDSFPLAMSKGADAFKNKEIDVIFTGRYNKLNTYGKKGESVGWGSFSGVSDDVAQTVVDKFLAKKYGKLRQYYGKQIPKIKVKDGEILVPDFVFQKKGGGWKKELKRNKYTIDLAKKMGGAGVLGTGSVYGGTKAVQSLLTDEEDPDVANNTSNE
jgi:hypothetical protein